MATIGSLAVNVVAKTSSLEKGLGRASKRIQRFSRRAKRAFSTMATGVGGAAAAVASLVRSNEQLDRSMNRSLAIMGNVSDQMRGEMKTAAIELSAEVSASAKDIADSYFFLASAGLSATESLKSLPIVTKFAQAGNFDLATATDLLTDSQSALGLSFGSVTDKMRNMQRLGDQLVKANTLANASVEQFSLSLTTKAAASFRMVGKSSSEALAVLSAFADAGVKGQDAGTQLSIVMRELSSKAIKNEKAFERANVSVFDSAGEMRNMADVIGDLEAHLSGLSDKQKKQSLQWLGFTDKSISGLSTLVGMSEKIRDYEEAIATAGGTMETVAGRQMTALEESTNSLSSAWQALASETGPVSTAIADQIGKASDSLRGLNLLIENISARGEESSFIRGVGKGIKRLSEKYIGRNLAGSFFAEQTFGRLAMSAGAITDAERAKFLPAAPGQHSAVITGEAYAGGALGSDQTEEARAESGRKASELKNRLVAAADHYLERLSRGIGVAVESGISSMRSLDTEFSRANLARDLLGISPTAKRMPGAIGSLQAMFGDAGGSPAMQQGNDGSGARLSLGRIDADSAEGFRALRRNLGGGIEHQQLSEARTQTSVLMDIRDKVSDNKLFQEIDDSADGDLPWDESQIFKD